MDIIKNLSNLIPGKKDSSTGGESCKITSQGIDREVQKLVNKEYPSHENVLSKLLENISEVNFHELGQIEQDKNLKQFETIVICVNHIIEQARKNDWGICRYNGFTYLYNGAYWKLLDDATLRNFLGKAALKQGISDLLSMHYDFREKLLKQFKSIAFFPAPTQDKGKVLINLLNGTLEISTEIVELNKFEPSDFLSYQLPFKYDEIASCNRFHKYLNKVLPEKVLQDILAEYMAYIFIPHSALKLEKALLLYGTGANGKSVFFDVMNSLFGRENISTYSIASLTDEKGYQRAMIGNKLLNYASEFSNRFENSLFKQLVSGEPVEARLPYGQPFILDEYAKLLFNVNELPRDVEFTKAFWRRFLIIPFNVTIPEAEQDKELAKKIIANELPGVLNWILEGLQRLTSQKGFTESTTINNLIAEFKQDSDSTLLFLAEHKYQPDKISFLSLKEVYENYVSFCLANNYKPLSNINFRKRLNSHGYNTEKKQQGQVVFLISE